MLRQTEEIDDVTIPVRISKYVAKSIFIIFYLEDDKRAQRRKWLLEQERLRFAY